MNGCVRWLLLVWKTFCLPTSKENNQTILLLSIRCIGMSITRLLVFLFAVVSIFLCGFSAHGQDTSAPIILKDIKLNVIPRQYYISGVADEYSERGPVASLIQMDAAHKPATKLVELQGGTARGIKQFLYRNLHRDTTLRPVIIVLKEFKLTETRMPGGTISGRLAIDFSFILSVDDTNRHLVDYTGGLRYSRPEKQAADVESLLRQGIGSAISYFNGWMEQQADNNPLLAKEVKVRFTDYTEKQEGDTIYYSANRPLTWDDFKEKPREGRFEAEILAGIGYIERREVVKGVIYIDLEMKVEVAKSDCWVKDNGRSDYSLNHEQRHFDIEKIVAEHFKRKIKEMRLPVDNFDGPINVEYLETLREATRMQKLYDADTRHGLDNGAQARWNEKIDRELKELGVKK
jgi:hypothetical protein